MDISKQEILDYLNKPFFQSVLERAEKGEEKMKSYVAEIIETFKTQAGIQENNAMVFHYILSLLFSSMTEIEHLKEIIAGLVNKEL